MRIRLGGSSIADVSEEDLLRGLRRVTVVIDAAPLVAFGDAKDERHFRVVAPLQGGAFTILPSDS